jgi:glycosyltransferase involved in cell wall biosynthesis
VDSKVSIITPTYNRARLLTQTLASVYDQTWCDYEIIVVDDGSEDDTPALGAASAQRLVYHRIEHAGASAARNAGLAIARGEYIAFLDSDDLWERQFLERMTTALDSAPAAGFVYCDYATFNTYGPVQPACLAPRYKLRGNLFARLIETDFISTGTLLIRRECLRRVGGFDPNLEIAHDWDLWLRLAREFDAEYVDESLVRIRMDSVRLTRNTPVLYSDNLQILTKLRRSADAADQLCLIRRNTLACHRGLFKYFWGIHRSLPALEHFARMLAAPLL